MSNLGSKYCPYDSIKTTPQFRMIVKETTTTSAPGDFVVSIFGMNPVNKIFFPSEQTSCSFHGFPNSYFPMHYRLTSKLVNSFINPWYFSQMYWGGSIGFYNTRYQIILFWEIAKLKLNGSSIFILMHVYSILIYSKIVVNTMRIKKSAKLFCK